MKMSYTNKPKIYISCSIHNESAIKVIAEIIEKAGGEPVYWKTGTPYDETELDKADAVIFYCPGKMNNISNMTRGMRTELLRAINNNKPRFITKTSAAHPGLIHRLELNYDLAFLVSGNHPDNILNFIEFHKIKTTPTNYTASVEELSDIFAPPKERKFY